MLPTIVALVDYILSVIEQKSVKNYQRHALCTMLVTLTRNEEYAQLIVKSAIEKLHNYSCYIEDNNRQISDEETDVLIVILYIITQIFEEYFDKFHLKKKWDVNSNQVATSMQNIKARNSNDQLAHYINSCLECVVILNSST